MKSKCRLPERVVVARPISECINKILGGCRSVRRDLITAYATTKMKKRTDSFYLNLWTDLRTFSVDVGCGHETKYLLNCHIQLALL